MGIRLLRKDKETRSNLRLRGSIHRRASTRQRDKAHIRPRSKGSTRSNSRPILRSRASIHLLNKVSIHRSSHRIRRASILPRNTRSPL